MNKSLVTLILSSYFLIRTSSAQFCAPKYRLSTVVKPTYYTIKIHPQLNNDKFTGEVFMHIKVLSSIESIEFHVNRTYLTLDNIYFDSKKVLYFNTCNFPKDSFGYQFYDSELVQIFRKGHLFSPGSHIIHIKYSGIYSETTNGLFKISSGKHSIAKHNIIATEFQPSHARKVFPCFDEPLFKARFQINLVVPNNSYTALSNMRATQIYNTLDGVIYKFETTPPMSIYLLSFAVIPRRFKVQHVDACGLPFAIHSFGDTLQNDTTLLEFASKVINFYANYTQFKYKLPKIDFLGFDRYESSATENWGLVTFNASLLSSDNDVYDISQKVSVISHELAHFWFGNLVTNEWWDDIWLHESIATFMSLKAEDHILKNNASKFFPSLYSENLFFEEQTRITMPVINFQEDPVEVRKNFNDITYVKGASILRMLEAVIGEEMIRSIFVQYVKQYAYQVVTTDDFLNIVMNITSDTNVREFLETYLYQNHFPLIYITEKENNFVIYQNASHIPRQNNMKPSLGYKWTIPVTYITNHNSTPNLIWLNKDTNCVYLPKNNATWIKLNYQHIGYYRIFYSENLWNSLIDNIQDLEEYERNHLLFNAVSLFEINVASCDIVLQYVWKLSQPSYIKTVFVWAVYNRLAELIKYDKKALKKLQEFFTRAVQNAGKHMLAWIFSDAYVEHDNSTNSTPETDRCVQWLIEKSTTYGTNSSTTEAPQSNNQKNILYTTPQK